MSKDYRMSFISGVETALAARFTPEQIAIISHIVIKTLSEYEITERCTDLTVRDDINEKLMKRYFACLLVDGRSKGTITTYSSYIRRLSETIRKPFTEMSSYDIRFFLAMEQERGISAKSRDTRRACFLSFFQWMADDEIIDKNPVSKLKPIKCPKVVRKPFSDVEIDALRSACKTIKQRAIVEMLLSTGVRVAELSNMEIRDVNMDTLAVHVVHGKGEKERITYMTPVAAKYLIQYLDGRQDGFLFTNLYKEQMGTGGIRRVLKVLGERAGIDNVHPHRFRRTFATKLVKRGMEIQEVQRLLGHSDLNTTMTYVCMDDTNLQTSYKKHIA